VYAQEERNTRTLGKPGVVLVTGVDGNTRAKKKVTLKWRRIRKIKHGMNSG